MVRPPGLGANGSVNGCSGGRGMSAWVSQPCWPVQRHWAAPGRQTRANPGGTPPATDTHSTGDGGLPPCARNGPLRMARRRARFCGGNMKCTAWRRAPLYRTGWLAANSDKQNRLLRQSAPLEQVGQLAAHQRITPVAWINRHLLGRRIKVEPQGSHWSRQAWAPSQRFS